MNVRRVVTGHTPEGKAVVASDAAVEPFTFGDGGAYHVLWGADVPARFPDDGAAPAWTVERSAPAKYWGPSAPSRRSRLTSRKYQSFSTTSAITWKPGSTRGMFTHPSK